MNGASRKGFVSQSCTIFQFERWAGVHWEAIFVFSRRFLVEAIQFVGNPVCVRCSDNGGKFMSLFDTLLTRYHIYQTRASSLALNKMTKLRGFGQQETKQRPNRSREMLSMEIIIPFTVAVRLFNEKNESATRSLTKLMKAYTNFIRESSHNGFVIPFPTFSEPIAKRSVCVTQPSK